MALPSPRDSYRTYTDQLVYFSARLQADPHTAELAPQVDELLASLDEAHLALREARRAELRARARRDHRDKHGDAQVRKFNRRLAVIGVGFVRERVFPKGVRHAVSPRGGRAQLRRLDQVREATQELLASPRVIHHPEAEELGEVLEGGKQMLTELLAELGEAVELWEARSRELVRARDVFDFRRSDGVGKLGVVLGELRARLGGNNKDAYAYTQPARTRDSGEADEEADDAEVGDELG